MPNYSSSLPPLSLSPGDVGFSFNNEAVPSSAQAGSQFALPHAPGTYDQGCVVRWQDALWHRAFGNQREPASGHGRRGRGIQRHRREHEYIW